MSNPIFSDSSNFNAQSHSSLWDVYNQVRQSQNPEQTMQILLSNNPQYKNVMNYIQQNGGDAKSAFYNMAAQMGVDPNIILSKLK